MGDRSGVTFQLTLRECIAWLFRRRKRYHVEGGSMEPLFVGGEEVLVAPYARRRDIRDGDVVVVCHPSRRDFLLIKRVHHVDARRSVVDIRGLNAAASTDSRSFGAVHCKDVLGRVTAVLK